MTDRTEVTLCLLPVLAANYKEILPKFASDHLSLQIKVQLWQAVCVWYCVCLCVCCVFIFGCYRPWIRQLGQQQICDNAEQDEDVGCQEVGQSAVCHIIRRCQVHYRCHCAQCASHGLTWDKQHVESAHRRCSSCFMSHRNDLCMLNITNPIHQSFLPSLENTVDSWQDMREGVGWHATRFTGHSKPLQSCHVISTPHSLLYPILWLPSALCPYTDRHTI